MSKNISNIIIAILICSSSFIINTGCGAEHHHPNAWTRAASQRDTSTYQSDLGPDKDLIYAVKGVKNGAALLVGMVNPVLGIMVAAADYKESPSDLIKINDALSRGAHIDYTDRLGWSALAYAAYYGYPHIAEHLLNHNATRDLPVSKGSWAGYTPLEIAKYYETSYQKRRINCEPDMVEFYDRKIARYQKLINLLA